MNARQGAASGSGKPVPDDSVSWAQVTDTLGDLAQLLPGDEAPDEALQRIAALRHPDDRLRGELQRQRAAG